MQATPLPRRVGAATTGRTTWARPACSLVDEARDPDATPASLLWVVVGNHDAFIQAVEASAVRGVFAWHDCTVAQSAESRKPKALTQRYNAPAA